MADCDWEALSGPVTMVAASEDLVLEPALAARVERAWVDELREHPGRIDGQILVYVGREGDVLRGRFVPYRYFAGQRRDSVLARALSLAPLAVSGLLLCDGRVAFGRRALRTTQYAGWLELMPSGGIDRESVGPDGAIDHRGQLLRELAEETGIPRADVISMEAIAILRDRHDPVVDVGSVITVGPAGATAAESMVASGRSEYDALMWVAVPDLAGFVSDRPDIVPTSRGLCECLLASSRW